METNFSTKEKIIDAAIDLFGKKGYTETTMRAIARAVGIQAASIYNHFNSKDAILEEVLGQYQAVFPFPSDTQPATWHEKERVGAKEIVEHLFPQPPEHASGRYLKILKVIMVEHTRNRLVEHFLMTEILYPRFECIKRSLDLLISRKLIPSLDAYAVTSFLSAAAYAFDALSSAGTIRFHPDAPTMTIASLAESYLDSILREKAVLS